MAQFASAVILLAVSACTVMSAEERLAEFGKTCEAYGFQPTNDAYAECIQREVHAQDERDRARWDAVADTWKDAADAWDW